MGDWDDYEDEEPETTRVYFGPYFRCNSIPKVGTKNISTCDGPGCELRDEDHYWGNPVYCHKCGCKLVRKDIPDDRLRRCAFELSKEVGDELHPAFSHWRKDCDVWLPGRDSKLPRAPREFFLMNPPEIVGIDGGARVESEKGWLLYTLAPNGYRNLCRIYGDDSVTLEWGVLTWEE